MGTLRTLIPAVAWALLPGQARAVVPHAVALDARCTPPGVEAATVLTILEAEVAPARVRLVDPWTPITAAETGLVLDECTNESARVAVTVTHDGGADARFLALEDASPDARSRTLALAMAEALRGVPVTPDSPLPSEAETRPASTPPAPLFVVRRWPTEHESVDAPAASGSEPHFGFRAGAVMRVIPATAGLSAGVSAAATWGPFGVGFLAMGSEQSSEPGRLRVLAVAMTGSLEQALLAEVAGVRVEGELGSAYAFATARPGFIAEDQQTVHAGVSTSVWARLELAEGWMLEPSVGGGFARSSLGKAGDDADRSHGWFVGTTVAVRR